MQIEPQPGPCRDLETPCLKIKHTKGWACAKVLGSTPGLERSRSPAEGVLHLGPAQRPLGGYFRSIAPGQGGVRNFIPTPGGDKEDVRSPGPLTGLWSLPRKRKRGCRLSDALKTEQGPGPHSAPPLEPPKTPQPEAQDSNHCPSPAPHPASAAPLGQAIPPRGDDAAKV